MSRLSDATAASAANERTAVATAAMDVDDTDEAAETAAAPEVCCVAPRRRGARSVAARRMVGWLVRWGDKRERKGFLLFRQRVCKKKKRTRTRRRTGKKIKKVATSIRSFFFPLRRRAHRVSFFSIHPKEKKKRIHAPLLPASLATHAPPPRRRPAAAAAANNTSSGDLTRRAAAAATASINDTSSSAAADDEFHRARPLGPPPSSSSLSPSPLSASPLPPRGRSRSRGRLPTTSGGAYPLPSSSRHSSRYRSSRERGGGHPLTLREGLEAAWDTIMSGGIELFRSEEMALMQVRLKKEKRILDWCKQNCFSFLVRFVFFFFRFKGRRLVFDATVKTEKKKKKKCIEK